MTVDNAQTVLPSRWSPSCLPLPMHCPLSSSLATNSSPSPTPALSSLCFFPSSRSSRHRRKSKNNLLSLSVLVVFIHERFFFSPPRDETANSRGGPKMSDCGEGGGRKGRGGGGAQTQAVFIARWDLRDGERGRGGGGGA